MDATRLLCQEMLEAHPLDAALTLERLPAGESAALLEEFSPRLGASILQRMTTFTAVACVEGLSEPLAAAILEELPVDMAARLLRCSRPEIRRRLLERVSTDVATSLRRQLRYPEESAGAMMDPAILSLPSDITAREALARIRRFSGNVLYYLYVVDRNQALIGVLTLRELMLAAPGAMLAEIMRAETAEVLDRAGRTSILAHPAWREVHALPVVEKDRVFQGVIRYETLRRLQEEVQDVELGPTFPAAFMALGELCWTGWTGVLDALASAAEEAAGGRTPERRRS